MALFHTTALKICPLSAAPVFHPLPPTPFQGFFHWKKNKDKPSTPCIARVFRFILIMTYGHTFAVLSLQNGDDLKTVQNNLGHATAAFTLDVYGHVSERMKEDSAARMEAYIKSL